MSRFDYQRTHIGARTLPVAVMNIRHHRFDTRHSDRDEQHDANRSAEKMPNGCATSDSPGKRRANTNDEQCGTRT
jgi:hypothetical protein